MNNTNCFSFGPSLTVKNDYQELSSTSLLLFKWTNVSPKTRKRLSFKSVPFRIDPTSVTMIFQVRLFWTGLTSDKKKTVLVPVHSTHPYI